MTRPRILDLFCGAGGAAMGYHRAGFDVVGVDIEDQPHYPFRFIQADVIEYMKVATGWALESFDAIHASPPCQAYSTLKTVRPENEYPDLIAPTRTLLRATGLPYIIENVPGAPLDANLMLCGSSFGLGANGFYLRRHRYFEASFPFGLAPPCDHRGRAAILVAGHTSMTTKKPDGSPRSYQGSNEERAEAMGIDWMTRDEIAEAIPPAYTEYIGERLLEVLEVPA